MIIINPSSNRQKKLGSFSRYVPICTPVGIGYLTACLLRSGAKAKILDEELELVTEAVLDEQVKGLEKPYIFGISALTAGIGRAYQLSEMMKKKYPDSMVILGNVHPTVLPEEVLLNKNVDLVVRGEAEEILCELYDRIKKGLDFTAIKSLSFRRNGTVIHNEMAELPQLEKLPRFPYHIFKEYSDKYELGFIQSSRGCPYNCIFCSQRAISGRKYRFIPSEIVVQDMEDLILKYKRSYITFTDDSFLVNKERVMRLCHYIRERGFETKAEFDCQARGDTVSDEILKELKASGFRTIHFGIETASERLMKLINKKETVQQVKDGIKLSKKYGFQVSGTFILGLPTESSQDRNAAYQLAKELSLDYVRFNNATPYPGTRLYEIAIRENRLNTGRDYENLNACGSLVESPLKRGSLAYVPGGVTEKELQHDILKFNLFYSFRLSSILKILKERIGPAGWLALPERWYFKPAEWLYLSKFAMRILFSFVRIFMYDLTDIFRLNRSGNTAMPAGQKNNE